MEAQPTCPKCGAELIDSEPHECQPKKQVIICGACNQEIEGDIKAHQCPPWAKILHNRFTHLHHRLLILEREVGFQPKTDTKRTLLIEKIEDLYQKINDLTKPKED